MKTPTSRTSNGLAQAVKAEQTPKRVEPEMVTFLIVPRFNMSAVITMIDTLRVANYLAPSPLYTWEIVSLDGSMILASNGMQQPAIEPPERNRRGELVFVVASWGSETYNKRETLSWIRRQSRAGARICAVELGCYLVARAGLAEGIEMAVHWSWAPGFHEQFHGTVFREQLFIHDQKIMSCAGAMAGVDLMLKLISKAHGERMAGEIADQMLHHPVRPGNAPQRRTMGRGTDTLVPMVREAINLIESQLSEPLSVPEVAKSLGVSQRQLERQFRQGIGCTVVQFSLLLRLQHARVLLISTSLSIREIATASGFNTLSHFAYSFGKHFGRRPSDYRQAWPERDNAPTWPGTLASFLQTLEQRGLEKAKAAHLRKTPEQTTLSDKGK
ncbi:GlxA family transcriptional regulator [Roseovarius arcticus]|uniref:GlxA family transcriptional regulator n=1 Tax=Roseovarius arcticus TaxID=2547404 RepID=UPI001FE269C0|nr:GlxA family transcriptional regulator [Roseovarius arcticus]